MAGRLQQNFMSKLVQNFYIKYINGVCCQQAIWNYVGNMKRKGDDNAAKALSNKRMTLKEKFEMMKAMGKNVVIYFDMDGVLAEWEVGCTYEKTWTERYFLYRDLEVSVRDAVLLLMEAGFECSALSAAYEEGTAREDKYNWLNNNGLTEMPRLFVPCGKNKADFIEPKENTTYILLDDYNFNLNGWESAKKDCGNFIAVKFLNGINGGSDVWQGRTIHHKSSGEIIAHTLADIAVMS
jgi:hypothetical protein